jgi:heme a synthase
MSLSHTRHFSSISQSLRSYSVFVCIAVFCLIFKGALVTSFDAGLSVPDWPTTNGQNMFSYPYSLWVGGIFYEHAHRLLASIIGFLTVGLAVWIYLSEPRRWVRTLGLSAVALVIIQGMLGGLTVLLRLPDAISVAHGTLGQTFLLVLITIAFVLSRTYEDIRLGRYISLASHPEILRALKLGFIMLALLYMQLLLGAATRHSESGLAIPDFPTMGGEWIPRFDQQMIDTINEFRSKYHLRPVTYGGITIHLLHRVGAVIAAIGAVLLSLHLFALQGREPLLGKLAPVFSILVVLQVTLGIITVLSVRNPWITSLHVITGAGLLAVTYLICLRAATLTTTQKGIASHG